MPKPTDNNLVTIEVSRNKENESKNLRRNEFVTLFHAKHISVVGKITITNKSSATIIFASKAKAKEAQDILIDEGYTAKIKEIKTFGGCYDANMFSNPTHTHSGSSSKNNR